MSKSCIAFVTAFAALIPVLAAAAPDPVIRQGPPLGFGSAGVATPTNLTLHTNPADCKSAQFSPEDLQSHPDLESLCEYELKTGQDTLATWTWSQSPCGFTTCDAILGFLPFSGGVPFFVPFKPDARAELFYDSDLASRRCVTLRAFAGSDQAPVYSADSSAACLPLEVRPFPFPAVPLTKPSPS